MRYLLPGTVLILLLVSWSSDRKHIPSCKFRFDKFTSLNIPEPSDVQYDEETGHMYIVSDHGILYECDSTGKIIRKAKDEGMDFEGVEIVNGFVYVSDETPRKVYKYRKSDLSLVDIYSVSWSGAMNKAFESITYNASKHCYVLVSQQPVVIFEYDSSFHELHHQSFHYAGDISSARWYKGDFYLLSNMDNRIFQCDPLTYDVKKKWDINVLNPEGIAFDARGNVTITSDDLQRLYFFKNLPLIK